MIQIKGVTKQFKNETAIDYRDMTFETGKSYMLLGASGCGKSTLLNMIAGILSVDSGVITVDGEDMSRKTQREKDRFRIEKIGYIFQDFKLITDMTVMDNINILRLEGVDTSRAPELLKKLGIYEQRGKKVKHLSGGQKQRVAIVRALVKLPDIILADEPTGNLNFAIGEAVMRELTEISRGKTLIAVTHDERLAKYFDVVVDMNEMTGGRRDLASGETGAKEGD
ncbi:MAG: ABC transporter ATP-binding protein [Clostridiales bacterium]|nr:ABC transporter ATP-binding protein [Clostridiales bacterium]HCG67510.1 macrolide ABC transporter ATP-binding protein [Clostridiales bacterium]